MVPATIFHSCGPPIPHAEEGATSIPSGPPLGTGMWNKGADWPSASASSEETGTIYAPPPLVGIGGLNVSPAIPVSVAYRFPSLSKDKAFPMWVLEHYP